ncbi:MAG: hypothetical protein A2655_01080 [Candidatus Yanofskybacteria bacterium RIFCSPHIGHO2_01_FULL_43_42]|uniref:Uncharacterized protein n=1 Tax=Candidatus Yanofskybacteria bacterium RIFCSPLOWO2_01_FULL_43_22 TaxID=1802695 RepID=A0A1F8GEG6_9BACT|nr:MAG: hypothetical protein A2655_01080 [Candidatus Yanofskybacteria bacterium RIFCSPHIGHO2_01_FULL_43_42]OGN12403.1 MAG: hypothetical protein A3D48_01810 [Candidatus Yanofskybacteria bacterium RIFCSPHIGHO2_02_FULL_43_17]OGN23775.1 MAG: hypothetical protein A3A13_01870 [Candidatus Yanofskybacteria bacterium RIFCSPLOWO2_01_FULL_43_22]
MKRFTLGRLLLAVLLAALFSGFGLVIYRVGNYFDHLDAYSGHIVRQDESAARDGLKDLQYFHEQNQKLDKVWLSWVAENYIFEDPACQRAAYHNLTKNYKKTIDEELQDKDGFCASFLRGNARWRQAQAIFANALTLPENSDVQKAEKEKQFKLADDMAATFARDDFEAALKANPSHAPSSWNYDLLSNSETRAKALMPKPGKIKVRVGVPGGGFRNPGPRGDDDKGEGKKSKDIDTNDPGPGQPGGKPRKVG